MSKLHLFFEMLPVILAFIAIFVCAKQAITTRRIRDRQVYVGMVICSTLLITAQTSWTYTLLQGLTEGTFLANMVWTVFNSAVMITFILSTRRPQ